MEVFYIVTRLYYKGDAETHSVQIFTDGRQAQTRYYNIIAADLSDDSVTYQYAAITDSNGNLVLPIVTYDRRQTPAE